MPPFSGEVRDGEVWGRGALDMKGQVAANAVAIASLAREGFEPAGDLIFAATADEEVGDDFGLSWLCEAHPDAVRCDYAINEGGGDRRRARRQRRLLLCRDGREDDRAVHASACTAAPGTRRCPGSPTTRSSRPRELIERIAAYRPEPQIQQEVEAFLQAVLGEVPAPRDASSRARASATRLAAELIEPLLAPTFAPTMISASRKRNVIPALCEVVVDCRLLPGQTPAEVEPIVRGVLGSDVDYDLEFLEARGRNALGARHAALGRPSSRSSRSSSRARAPVPDLRAGFTDSHWLREAFGTVAYGFFPSRAMTPELAATLIHSADERVPVADLELGVDWLRHAARTVCA